MAKAQITQQSQKKRIVLLHSMLQRARRRRRVAQSIIHTLITNRMRFIKIAMLLVILVTAGKYCVARPRPRSCRRLQRNTGWWDLIWTNYSDSRFKKTFRVSRGTFTFILDRIKHVLERKTFIEEPVPPELRLAICLYRLGRGSYLYTIAEMSGLGRSTVCTITKEVSQAIIELLWKESVTKYMPYSEQEFLKKIVEMEQMWQFLCCWGALDADFTEVSTWWP